MDSKIVIFSCGMDCAHFVDKHLDSIRGQTFQDFTHIIVDDCSGTDRLFRRLEQLKDSRTILHKNSRNQKWLKNCVDYLIPVLEGPEIVVVVDMDDWLSDSKVLQKIVDVYSDPTVQLTFGSYIKTNSNKRFPSKEDVRNVFYSQNHRKAAWVYSHLKTFKGNLLKSVDISYFKGPKGEWMPCGYDRAIMFPMIDICGIENTRFIQDVLYIYNIVPTNSVHKIYKADQAKYKKYVAEMAPHPKREII